jgi:peroxiredoxin
VIGVGEPVPDVRVWTSDRNPVALRELAPGSAYLLLFYLFDWSST